MPPFPGFPCRSVCSVGHNQGLLLIKACNYSAHPEFHVFPCHLPIHTREGGHPDRFRTDEMSSYDSECSIQDQVRTVPGH